MNKNNTDYNCFNCKALCCRQAVIWINEGDVVDLDGGFIYKNVFSLGMNPLWFALYGFKPKKSRVMDRDVVRLRIPRHKSTKVLPVRFGVKRGFAFGLKCRFLDRFNRCKVHSRKPKFCRDADCPLKREGYSHVLYDERELGDIKERVFG